LISGKLFLLAATLVHEFAHVVWLDPIIRLDGMVEKDLSHLSTGEYPINDFEPRFTPDVLFAELRFNLEYQLFNGLPSLPHCGTPLDVEMKYDAGSNFRVPLALVDVKGFVTDLHLISRNGIFASFHATDNPLWTVDPMEEGVEPQELELLYNSQALRRPTSTIITSPPRPYDPKIPIVKMPDPNELKPALTAANELYTEVYGHPYGQQQSCSQASVEDHVFHLEGYK
jgi:hypothetical protein